MSEIGSGSSLDDPGPVCSLHSYLLLFSFKKAPEKQTSLKKRPKIACIYLSHPLLKTWYIYNNHQRALQC